MRRNFLLLFFAVVSATSLLAQNSGAAVPDWENPRVFGINKEPARATFTPFPDEPAAMNEDQPSKLVESLNGDVEV